MKKSYKVYVFYALFVIAYLTLTWITPSNRNPAVAHYNLTPGKLHLISLSVAVPLLAIWFTAFYGYAKLADYARLIKKSRDGKKVSQLAQGIGALALVLPLISVISAAFNYIGQTHSSLLTDTTIANSYTSLALPLIAFMLISRAARSLLSYSKEQSPFWAIQLFALCLALVSAIYGYSTFTILKGRNIGGLITHKIYYQPIWLVILTIMVPYIFMWAIGGLAALDINSYSRRSAGILYRHNWNYISAGISTVIAAEIIEQYLTSLSVRLSHVHLSGLLVIIYLLLILIAAGFILIAIGANKLRKIEAV